MTVNQVHHHTEGVGTIKAAVDSHMYIVMEEGSHGGYDVMEESVLSAVTPLTLKWKTKQQLLPYFKLSDKMERKSVAFAHLSNARDSQCLRLNAKKLPYHNHKPRLHVAGIKSPLGQGFFCLQSTEFKLRIAIPRLTKFHSIKLTFTDIAFIHLHVRGTFKITMKAHTQHANARSNVTKT